MIPAIDNIIIYRDRDFLRVYVLKDTNGTVINLTSYTAKAQIRPVKDSATLIATFTSVITPLDGKITITLTDTSTLAFDESKAWWDLELTNPSGLRQNYVEGAVAIKGTVTRT